MPIIAPAGERLRERIARARHQVYALELGQHAADRSGRLGDRLDAVNHYIAATVGDRLAGFISVTPAGHAGYSVDKYFTRSELPFEVDGGLHEVRLLTVMPGFRSSGLAAALMLAAFRWIESQGGTRIVAIGRREVKRMYLRCGLRDAGKTVEAGAVNYDLMHAAVAELRGVLDGMDPLVGRIEGTVDWRLGVSLRKPAGCFHGGAFFDAIGPGFQDLGRHRDIINADVLDAWYPPAPEVVGALREHLPWLARTSPPTDCAGLVAAISSARGVPEAEVLVGAGSSDLIFRAFPRWLNRRSRVLLLDPTYGEYAHVLGKVIGCGIERFPLRREENHDVDLERLRERIASGPDLVVLVNPNSPTGRVLGRGEVESLVAAAPGRTLVWVDETYIDFTGGSVERLVGRHGNLVVCKSMSKAYALSGMRVAYLVASRHRVDELRAVTPPWVVGLPSQVAAVKALACPDYYERRWRATSRLRESLAGKLRGFGWDVVPGCANFLLAHLPPDGPTAAELAEACRDHGLFIRDAVAMGGGLGDRAVRIAVKDPGTQRRMIEILARILASGVPPGGGRTGGPG
ncbi:pyridoxal phosphate-dependent aminotransferase [Luteolibacter marinus]|uniref:pyridoxal phosphate-dependent aminotransferase n=1 Tax=Luteolibacter marinus TaxID=2776705 RepID=UPI0018696634|nr:histidinol-phosphate transaminase [Luteolibacter marinus]